jgi:acyl-coenzyme A synthetase/AMP-(fatty) acid ligase
MRRQKESLVWARWTQQQTLRYKKTALIEAATGVTWTIGALADASFRFSSYLAGYGAGERIAFRLPNGPEWMTLFLALQRAGLAAVPLDAGMPLEGCLEIARRLDVRALYLDGEFHALGKVSSKNKNCCCIKITSGSGAVPKAVECRAEHLLADGDNVAKSMGIRRNDLNLAAIPLGHSYGLGNLVMPLILQGTAMVWVNRYHVTVFPGVPALFRVLAALPEASGKMKSLRTAISAGAVLAPAVAQAFFVRYGIKVHNFYGSSETGGICYDKTGNASLNGRSVGKPLVGVSVAVKAGRVTVEGPAVATRGGHWRLADLGEWTGRGELVLLGRVGLEANIGGKKVHPLEVERILRSLPGVTDAIVWLDHSEGRDLLVAGVETTQSRAEVERALAAKLPAWKLPKAYFVSRELPRTSRGKLDLIKLRQI